mmetsp:Transcript_34934/g.76282  ORF Transcript_34934/g.76282 Transcript_34934/m.76282 type:complete len:158 (-) Transcript_34934:246-719(-)|eukprot:CAMPEP_0116896722 /NCGR_PEP_ID=MMETSP0467-20121206/5896_1 /TAXON_ID=283647 /ORGANISM="Mesodinium pulex, Strain SPMC105" /LENGTH=157 /DNA_ID=CAMNT_0004568037 /DNA_START=1700 /DNA_END=2173 /DNA_ORIENTATION=-
MHLSNVTLQSNQESFNLDELMVDLNTLRTALEGDYGEALVTRSFNAINELILHTLRSVAFIADERSYELYGFDVMIDIDGKPWLLEVNASPAMSSRIEKDRVMKTTLANAMFDILGYGDFENEFEFDLSKIGLDQNVKGFNRISSAQGVNLTSRIGQ